MSLRTYDRLTAALALLTALTACTGEEEVGSTSDTASGGGSASATSDAASTSDASDGATSTSAAATGGASDSASTSAASTTTDSGGETTAAPGTTTTGAETTGTSATAATAATTRGCEVDCDLPLLEFDGQDDRVTVAEHAAIDAIGLGPFTFEAWVRGVEDEQNAHPQIMSNRLQHAVGFTFGFHNQWGGSAHKIPYVQLGGINWIDYPGQPHLLDGAWHHFVARRDGTALTYFADGVEVITLNLPEVYSLTSDHPLWIGHDFGNLGSTAFDGVLAEVRLWSVARSDAEIAANMDVVLSGDEPGLLGSWRLRAGDGQIAADQTEREVHDLT